MLYERSPLVRVGLAGHGGQVAGQRQLGRDGARRRPVISGRVSVRASGPSVEAGDRHRVVIGIA